MYRPMGVLAPPLHRQSTDSLINQTPNVQDVFRPMGVTGGVDTTCHNCTSVWDLYRARAVCTSEGGSTRAVLSHAL